MTFDLNTNGRSVMAFRYHDVKNVGGFYAQHRHNPLVQEPVPYAD